MRVHGWMASGFGYPLEEGLGYLFPGLDGMAHIVRMARGIYSLFGSRFYWRRAVMQAFGNGRMQCI